jgi:putative AlgH/UPF0301 family transcriptional regulator
LPTINEVPLCRKDLAALMLGAAASWLKDVACAGPGRRATVLAAAPGFTDPAYQHAVVVLQRDGSDEIGVMINRPAGRQGAALVLWQPGELAEDLRRGLWLKLEVPLETLFRRDGAQLWDELLSLTSS